MSLGCGDGVGAGGAIGLVRPVLVKITWKVLKPSVKVTVQAGPGLDVATPVKAPPTAKPAAAKPATGAPAAPKPAVSAAPAKPTPKK